MGISELVRISDMYGRDPEFVLAGGGNTSYKDNEHLFIKASGVTLSGITEAGFVKMKRASLDAIWEKKYPEDEKKREAEVLEDLMKARAESGASAGRPSVETSLHALFPQSYVVHTHPSLINGLTCGKKGEEAVREIFGDSAFWIGETKPGYILASTVREKMREYTDEGKTEPEIVFLQNHGVFVAAGTVERIKKIYDDIVRRISARIIRKPDFSPVDFDREKAEYIAPALRMLLMREKSRSIVTFRTNREIMGIVRDEVSMGRASKPFSPDHIVYCRHSPVFIPDNNDKDRQLQEAESRIKEYEAVNGFTPRIIAVEGLGIFAWGSTKKEADTAAELFADAVKVSVYSESFGGQRFLSDAMTKFILEWEVESYRQKVSFSNKHSEKLAGKIAIVTGSAQGFGKGIADEMAAEGAYMVIADINYEAAAQNAASLTAACGRGKAMAVRVDVSDENQVKTMISDTILEFGGLDIFVSNAGILRAGGLEEMDLAGFELVTKINYTAYFLCAKFASAPMKIQHRFMQDYYMDIIQINSKSGLEGSNRNFAYAGGKFGGIGLTQSFALELVEYGIKVNAICP
ncbi:MAG: SDR family NAD(P)-dependent oxidoreductase, partial [Eubacteriales bacterium]|nr:SDR family NAD(P)-dependent oxidoreductase [Eubacteriales bacterium]